MIRFIEKNSTTCRVLLRDEAGGIWLIDHGTPAAPFVIPSGELDNWQRIPTPGTYVLASKKLTPPQEKRFQLIQPLLDDARCITDKAHRLQIAKIIAEKDNTTVRRLLRMYYRYLATGTLTGQKGRTPQSNPDYDWAIRTFYYSAKKLSLRAAYEMMLLQRYTDENGCLVPKAPTWSSFQHYFYARNYHKKPQKVIARDGLTYYQRNCRPKFGITSNWRSQPGAYQMDATQADIYLVSRLDRSCVIGRPYIYLAIDTATQLITGIYVGMDAGEAAVMMCLVQAAGDKVAFCHKYGIEITEAQWPCRGLPNEVITDQGREFNGSRMEELCQWYGVEMQTLPPFRPDRKGLVEKAFDLLQQRYKPLLRGKGVIEADAQERWATDYRSQAVLDLDEFTQVIIHTVIYLNSGRLLGNGKSPAQQWLELAPSLLDVPSKELYLHSLPRTSVKLSRKGFYLNKLWYAPTELDGLYLGDTYPLAYDPADIGTAYVVMEAGYRRCVLTARSKAYQNLTVEELTAVQKREKQTSRSARQNAVEASTAAVSGIQKVIQQAEAQAIPPGKKQLGAEIKENQNRERRLLI